MDSTLIIGASGSGKTHMTLTWPRPILFLDLENKAENALPEWLEPRDQLTIEVIQDPPQRTAMKFHFGDRGLEPPKGEYPTGYRTFSNKLNEIYSMENPPKTLIVDSWSALSTQMVTALHAAKQTIACPTTLPDYGALHDRYIAVLPSLMGLPIDYLVVTAHEELWTDDNTNERMYAVSTIGRKIRRQLPRYFDNVLRTIVRGKPGEQEYLALTKSDGLFEHGKCSWPNTPPIGPQDYSKLRGGTE